MTTGRGRGDDWRTPIAIVGMACRYADADSPAELWRNVLACRQAFRRFPAGRLNVADYVSDDRTAADRTYAVQAAVLDGWVFDRVRHRIAGSTFRSTDLAQWLALDVATDVLADAGWPDGDGLPRERTAVLLGNTLTGEFSRARAIRLRWPYVRRTFAGALQQEGWTADAAQRFLARVEADFKAPFAPIDDEALAGSLSNTIAGRVCNTFDLGGGGYTVDGACSASLLAVITSCTALAVHDVDVALAGGVDVSLDPFELVGFAKVGALTPGAMRVYDARSQGFIPGEGCGFVALERLADAQARGARIYAVIRGWGTSSDGSGGITRPESAGQLLALRRAYARAGFGIGTVDLIEGHGTGTEVGDAAELEALSRARRADGFDVPAAIGSIKANIGHTKAASGAAGLMKAALSLHERVIPPTTGCERPHELLTGSRPALRVVAAGEPWPHGRVGRAGVTSAGFGGINTHVVLESRARRRTLSAAQRELLRSPQDAELLVFGGASLDELRDRVEDVRRVADELSLAELADLSATLHGSLPRRPAARAAIVASTPGELARGLEQLAAELPVGEPAPLASDGHVFHGIAGRAPSVGLLFPGQGSPTVLDGGALGRRFDWFARVARSPLNGVEGADTAVAQPAIVACSLGGLAFLRTIGVRGDVAVGHSLGELTALHWGGALGDVDVRILATARGRAMAQAGRSGGAMASIAADATAVRHLLVDGVVVAGLNGPRQTVVAGPATAVARVLRRAGETGIDAVGLPVSHAFHSPLVAPARAPLRAALGELQLRPLQRAVYSTITGELLTADADVMTLLVEQVTSPVRFSEALVAAAQHADLLVEVGPGHVLQDLARQLTRLPVLALDAAGPSLRPALTAAAALYAAGAATSLTRLFAGRFTRPFALDRPRAFLTNPCEQAPPDEGALPALGDGTSVAAEAATVTPVVIGDGCQDALAVVRRLVAERVELPLEAVVDDSRLLADLHLTSIAVAELAAAAARAIDVLPPAPPTEMSTATVAQLAAAIDAARTGAAGPAPSVPDGNGAWVRAFAVEAQPRVRPAGAPAPTCRWTVKAPADHPLGEAIEAAFAGTEGEPAVLVCLPPESEDSHVELLLAALDASGRVAFLQHRGGAGGFARSLWLERPDTHVCVIDMPPDPALLASARAEAEATMGFAEVHLDAGGARSVPVLRPVDPRPGPAVLHGGDVLLVSGGGKGIAAECALDLASTSGASAILLGRSRPEDDTELAENLARFAGAAVRHRYVCADVTDAAAVRRAVHDATRQLGAVTAIVHGAGVNLPARLEDLDASEIERTLAPKLAGARALLAAVDQQRLRLVVTFGSIIGRIGLRGEAHYALANDRLALLVARLREQLPACRCFNVEWSVWTGAGMADRLGTIAALAQAGVAPIPVAVGVRWLAELVRCPALPPSIVVSGRFGAAPTADLAGAPLALRRFLERPRVQYPGVELVVDSELTRGSDPYLDDHVLDGSALLPAVLGLEAMASVAEALDDGSRASRPVVITGGRFARPVTVPRDGARSIRLAGVRGRDGAVDVVLRSDETGFQADHFGATIRFSSTSRLGRAPALPDAEVWTEPGRSLYGHQLFHGPRFQRLRSFRMLGARACVAEIEVRNVAWFGAFLPQQLVLGDAASRDAAIHAVQACIPSDRLVPIGVDRITVAAPLEPGSIFVHARERHQDGDIFVYDLVLADARGQALERWEALALQRVGPIEPPARWHPALMSPYLERRLEQLIDGPRTQVAMIHANGPRRADADLAIATALGTPAIIRRRADGAPVANGAAQVSAAHLNGCTLAVAATAPVACDIELATRRRPDAWSDLLGAERLKLAELLTAETSEELDRSATRVWSAVECIKKAGMAVGQPLKLAHAEADGWAVLRCGRASVATLATQISGIDGEVVVALLASVK